MTPEERVGRGIVSWMEVWMLASDPTPFFKDLPPLPPGSWQELTHSLERRSHDGTTQG